MVAHRPDTIFPTSLRPKNKVIFMSVFNMLGVNYLSVEFITEFVTMLTHWAKRAFEFITFSSVYSRIITHILGRDTFE